MSELFIIAERDDNGLFWIEHGDVTERLAQLLVSTGKNLYPALRSSFVGGSAGAEFAYNILMRKLPLAWAKRYQDGAYSGDLKSVKNLAVEVADTLDTGPAPRSGADIVVKIREHIGCQQVMLARIAGVSKSMAHRWETGVSEPALQDILRLRDFANWALCPFPDTLILEALQVPKVKGSRKEK